jgi:hypothetical protein
MIEIAHHIKSSEKSIIFVDELDKIWEESSWKSYIRGEIFDILDGNFSAGLSVQDDGDSDDASVVKAFASPREKKESIIKLRYKTFLMAAGTFQDFFEKQKIAKIGFAGHHADSEQQISAEEIAKRLPRELTNRFNQNLIILPPLRPEHYRILSEAAGRTLPDWIRHEYHQAAVRLMDEAIAAQKGCRFVEECVLEALRYAHKPLEEKSHPEDDQPCIE